MEYIKIRQRGFGATVRDTRHQPIGSITFGKKIIIKTIPKFTHVTINEYGDPTNNFQNFGNVLHTIRDPIPTHDIVGKSVLFHDNHDLVGYGIIGHK